MAREDQDLLALDRENRYIDLPRRQSTVPDSLRYQELKLLGEAQRPVIDIRRNVGTDVDPVIGD